MLTGAETEFDTPSCRRVASAAWIEVCTVLLIFLWPISLKAQIANPSEAVGYSSSNRVVLPVSQILTPVGRQAELPEMRPQALALSPDGRLLVTAGKTHEIVVLDPAAGTILQRVPLPSDQASEPRPDAVSTHILQPDKEGQVSYTGLIFSPDGSRIYLSNVNGSIKVFGVARDGKVSGLFSIPLPGTGLPRRTNEIPSGLALSQDAKRLYVVLNLSNRLLELDLETKKPSRFFDVGVAPYDVALAGRKAYVSNWGGRRPDTNSVTGPAGRGTLVRVDPKRYIANEGSVSEIDLQTGRVVKEILVGLHSSALALTPNRRHLLVANAASDTVSVIDTRSDEVVETISLRWQPKDYFGASPNALAFDASGRTLYVCNGTQNALAMVSFRAGRSKLMGLIPVGWFPGAIIHDAPRKMLHVANIKGIGSGRRTLPGEPQKFSSHQYLGTLSLVPVPNKAQLVQHTRTVLANCRREMIEASQLPPRPNQPPRPVPERAGEPSVFKHVVYIIKENRTYDQVLGDVKQGNGDPSLCIFGEQITPNQHKMVREFALLDNTYCSGILSADGHQWATTGITTDYMEKSFAGFPRSYPDGMEDDDVDALAYSPGGFIWDNALEHGKTIRDYGEFAIAVTGWKDPQRKPAPKFIDFYNDFTKQTGLTVMRSRPAIESLRPHLNMDTVGWSMDVPDVFRAAQFIKELKEYERTGNFPNLIIICLPNDHTSGTKARMPTPAAHVADNDLAFGQIVEAISHSRFWKETCIFAIEDDPQGGWDHVSGYRTTAYVVSPYTKRGAVVSTQYNQPGMLRTIELMLGLPPMNQMDAAATSMADCFTTTPDFTPFKAVRNNIPLDQLNPERQAIKDPVQRRYAELSQRLPLEQIDKCPEDLLNRILWFAQKGNTPYPTWAVLPKGKGAARD
ncbi:MAG: bifunctional YncE family protein/alkaline phosphatase family protein [Verrucomicrobia bacterium]|nr:bifunctional YncE family protein/alkaline phosphatase family protein [Verrucomicrobiota bacterium]